MEDMIVVYSDAMAYDVYTAIFNGQTWTSNKKIQSQNGYLEVKSQTAPGVAVLNGWLYIVYKPLDDNYLRYAWFDGTKWNGGDKIKVNGVALQSITSPQIAELDGTLYMVFLSPDHTAKEMYYAWFNGTTWGGSKPIYQGLGTTYIQSNINPAVCAYKRQLYIFYPNFTNELCAAWFDGTDWDGGCRICDLPAKDGMEVRPIPGAIAPGVAEYKGTLYLAYPALYMAAIHICTFDGKKWAGNVRIEDQPNGCKPLSQQELAPGLCAFKDKLHLIYKRPKSLSSANFDLNYCYFDGKVWDGDTPIRNQPGGISPITRATPHVTTTRPAAGLSNWMSALPNETLISDINLPGSHDAAAIRTGIFPSPYDCQVRTITQQLEYGIRILDVRLKVKLLDNGTFDFLTCHGKVFSDSGKNEYQSFPSLMVECENFLATYSSETVLMILKIDDWTTTETIKDQVFAALQHLLASFRRTTFKTYMPTLGEVRGKIHLYIRESKDATFATPLDWAFNTEGSSANINARRTYKVWVQDKFTSLSLSAPGSEKFNLVTKAFGMKKNGEIVLNFASATQLVIAGVYINDYLLNYFGQNDSIKRPSSFGWILFDFGLHTYPTSIYAHLSIVTIIISSNFKYKGYEKKFSLLIDPWLP